MDIVLGDELEKGWRQLINWSSVAACIEWNRRALYFVCTQDKTKYRAVNAINLSVTTSDALFEGYLEDVAIRHFKALGTAHDWATHPLYLKDIWEELLAGKRKAHRLLQLHVLIHFRQQEIARVIQQLYPLEIMGDHVSTTSRYSQLFFEGEALGKTRLAGLILSFLRQTRRVGSDTSSAKSGGSSDKTRDGSMGADLGFLSADVVSEDLALASCHDSLIAVQSETYFNHYCELILFQLNDRLVSMCEDPDDEGKATLLLWAKAIPGVVRKFCCYICNWCIETGLRIVYRILEFFLSRLHYINLIPGLGRS